MSIEKQKQNMNRKHIFTFKNYYSSIFGFTLYNSCVEQNRTEHKRIVFSMHNKQLIVTYIQMAV